MNQPAYDENDLLLSQLMEPRPTWHRPEVMDIAEKFDTCWIESDGKAWYTKFVDKVSHGEHIPRRWGSFVMSKRLPS